jgi:hypothetical protein
MLGGADRRVLARDQRKQTFDAWVVQAIQDRLSTNFIYWEVFINIISPKFGATKGIDRKSAEQQYIWLHR